MTGRERALSDAFVSIASSLMGRFDLVDMLSELAGTCAGVLGVGSAGLLLADGRQVLHVLAASSETTGRLQLVQLQSKQGPCLDCYRTGTVVRAPDMRAATGRWPHFAAVAAAAGVGSVHSVPLRVQGRALGALGLFDPAPRALDDEDIHLGQALADVASVVVTQERTLADKDALAEQLHTALSSRVVLEQAKGVIAQQGGLDMTQAFAVLRQYARDHNQRLTELAAQVVSRRLPAQRLLEQARPGASTSGHT